MGRFDATNTHWPPFGWRQFSSLTAQAGHAVAKDIGRGRIFGLQYRIDSMPLVQGETKVFRHDIAISGWDYSILGESCEYPVLSFSVTDRFDEGLSREYFIGDIRSYDTAIPHSARSATRAVSAALFLMRQISNGAVPDVNRVLRIYRLHPAQAFLYRTGDFAKDRLKSAVAGAFPPLHSAAKL